MELQINGQKQTHPEGLTVADLLGRLGLDSVACAVERNRQIVTRADHASTVLQPDDQLEIVTLVGGG